MAEFFFFVVVGQLHKDDPKEEHPVVRLPSTTEPFLQQCIYRLKTNLKYRHTREVQIEVMP